MKPPREAQAQNTDTTFTWAKDGPLQLAHAKGLGPTGGSQLTRLWALGEVGHEAGNKIVSTNPGLLSGAPGKNEVGPGVVGVGGVRVLPGG